MSLQVLTGAAVRGAVNGVEEVQQVDAQQLEGVYVVPGRVPQEGGNEGVAEGGDEGEEEEEDGRHLEDGGQSVGEEVTALGAGGAGHGVWVLGGGGEEGLLLLSLPLCCCLPLS